MERTSQNTTTNKKIRTTIATILILAIGFFYLQRIIAEQSSDDILQPYLDADHLIESAITSKTSNDEISSEKLKVLQGQYQIIRRKKDHHLKITKMMNAYYFASTLIVAILTIIFGNLTRKGI